MFQRLWLRVHDFFFAILKMVVCKAKSGVSSTKKLMCIALCMALCPPVLQRRWAQVTTVLQSQVVPMSWKQEQK